MNTRNDLANFLGLPIKSLTSILYSKPRKAYYIAKTIKKSNGKDRQIHVVANPLKYLQGITLQKLSSIYTPSSYAHGFVKEHSILTNSRYHVKKKLVIKLDIENFFPSITFARVRGMFMHYPFNFGQEAATTLSQICCLDDDNGEIAQGASTSPYIANMICRQMDGRLMALARKFKMHYTRYADDLTFSTNKHIKIEEFLQEVSESINSAGFKINIEKTRIMKQHQRQAITGLVVNDGINVNRKYLRNLRAILNNCEQKGVKSQVVRNSFKDQRNSRCKIWEIADQWVDQQGEPINVKVAKKKFLLFLKGKIEFYGQVAFSECSKKSLTEYANLDDLTKKQSKRIMQYICLLDRWIKLARIEQGEEFVSRTQMRVNRLYEALRSNKEIISLLKNENISDLLEIIRSRAIDDPRFFLGDLTSDNVDKLRTGVASILSKPCPSPEKTKAILSEFKISGKFLHDLTHQNYHTNRREFIRNLDELRNRLDLPPKLCDVLLSLSKLYFELPQNNKEVNLWEEASEQLKAFKRKIRLADIALEECTNWKDFLGDIVVKVQADYPRGITIHADISLDATLYTDVERFSDTLRWIFTSMLKNTNSNEIYIERKDKQSDEDHFYFEIFDDNINEISREPSREIANGKIRAAMKAFLGLGDYWIAANFIGSGWKQINLYNAKDITDVKEERTGFTHILRMPRI